ncbi:hypothetical protein IP78_07370 [Brevundimonas sp. AAP58]|uniref:hypothetical protein n=1 Tax=Brevundimonas sp. AAP58 TaxID=1523422 RepID=UPI0006B9150E|nr:hypothetical protein [Brevundimonas sp. AAP58]KPF80264.1 hypothetical protein IP78_07370 [Brevundimonas sp. AAP58]
MTCGIVLAAALLLSDPNVALAAVEPAAVGGAPVSIASEPLFADIVAQSSALRNIVSRQIETGSAARDDFGDSEQFALVRRGATSLAALNMQGHLILAERGTDGDLRCILRGIAEDIPVKLDAVEQASSPEARALALSELAYLLNDNVEVITAPPQPEA